MKVRLVSDLHLDSSPVCSATVSADIAIVCGDVFNGKPTVVIDKIIESIPEQEILFVPGNHEGFGAQDWNECLKQIEQGCRLSKKVHFLHQKNKIINGWNFIGATLWTSFYLPGQIDVEYNMFMAMRNLPDYKHLRLKGQLMTPTDVLALHKKDLAFLEKAIARTTFPTIVITHHAPTVKSIHPNFQNDLLNPAFVNALPEHFFKNVDYWFHGHTHNSNDYVHHKTRVISNPRGYTKNPNKSTENPSFSMDKVITLR